MSQIRLLLVEDQTIVRQALRGLLETEPSFVVCGETGTVAGAVAAAAELRPDVILMDLKLGEESGLEATRAILAGDPTARILALTAYDDFPMIEAAAAAGVAGYAPKHISFSELSTAIETVRQGGHYVHPSLASTLLSGMREHGQGRRHRANPLDQEEQRLVAELADGLSYGEIAARSFISERTVRRHVQRVLEKLGVTDRVQAVALAIRQGWL